jgi:hypothetical protein
VGEGQVGWKNADKLDTPVFTTADLCVTADDKEAYKFLELPKRLEHILFPNILISVWHNRSLYTVASMPFYTPSKSTFELAGKEFPRVTWYKEPNLRRLYITLMFAVLTSATNVCDKFLCPRALSNNEVLTG